MEHVTKRYGRRSVLEDVDLLLPTGSFNLVVGPNGAGKTTLLRLFSTFLHPTSGRVHWGQTDGTETTDPREARRHLGYAGHTPLLYEELTPLEHLRFALSIRNAAPDGRVESATERFGLAPRARDRVESLSRGWRQRVALAQAFIAEPDFLLLDEPASNLDGRGLEALLAALHERRRKSTIVVATHEPDPFRPLADRTLEIKDAHVTTWGEK